jgi:hypothetical protein
MGDPPGQEPPEPDPDEEPDEPDREPDRRDPFKPTRLQLTITPVSRSHGVGEMSDVFALQQVVERYVPVRARITTGPAHLLISLDSPRPISGMVGELKAWLRQRPKERQIAIELLDASHSVRGGPLLFDVKSIDMFYEIVGDAFRER